MCQLARWVLALALLLGTAARAQPSPAREPRQRTVTVTGNPADPPHELRAAQGFSTVLVFKSRINPDTLEVDRARVTIVEAGERSILFEPVIDLGRDERLVLSVRFADGQRAVFVLVPSPSEVDTRVDVVRRERTVESCQAELAEAQARCSKITPARVARAGLLTAKGVTPHNITLCGNATATAGGLICQSGTAYVAETWALVDVEIRNGSNQPRWTPSEVTLKGMKSGVPVPLRAVEVEPAQISPGEEGHIFVEVAPSDGGEAFTLELKDPLGKQSLTLPGVDLSARENKP